jgi:hypothetical protein
MGKARSNRRQDTEKLWYPLMKRPFYLNEECRLLSIRDGVTLFEKIRTGALYRREVDEKGDEKWFSDQPPGAQLIRGRRSQKRN